MSTPEERLEEYMLKKNEKIKNIKRFFEYRKNALNRGIDEGERNRIKNENKYHMEVSFDQKLYRYKEFVLKLRIELEKSDIYICDNIKLQEFEKLMHYVTDYKRVYSFSIRIYDSYLPKEVTYSYERIIDTFDHVINDIILNLQIDRVAFGWYNFSNIKISEESKYADKGSYYEIHIVMSRKIITDLFLRLAFKFLFEDVVNTVQIMEFITCENECEDDIFSSIQNIPKSRSCISAEEYLKDDKKLSSCYGDEFFENPDVIGRFLNDIIYIVERSIDKSIGRDE